MVLGECDINQEEAHINQSEAVSVKMTQKTEERDSAVSWKYEEN